MTTRLHCTTHKVVVEAPEGRLAGFIHIDRDAAGEVIGVAILPSRRVGSLLATWCAKVGEVLTAELREPRR